MSMVRAKYTSVGLPAGIRRRAAQAVDKSVNRVQEWLERDDRATEMFFAGTIITLFVLMLAANIVR